MKSDLISHVKHRHELALKDILQNIDIPAARIKEAIDYVLFPAGKRLRPVLVYLCGDLLAVPKPCLDIIAVSIEITHNYSLIHDDLPAMDNDDFRRGKPSCHRAFDEATAILAGDAMQALAIEILVKHLPKHLSPERVLAITAELVSTIGPSGMVSGQSLDLTLLTDPKLTEEELRTIHSLKTGKLISACINCALIAGQASLPAQEALQTYAKHLGLVFQMQDDYLDAYAPLDYLGKQRSSDASNNKITFASLYSQTALAALIKEQYQLAKDALAMFAGKNQDLLLLTESLEQRGHESRTVSDSLKQVL